MGLDSFSVDWLFQPLTQTGDRTLAHKYDSTAPGRGWSIFYNWTDHKYKLFFGDGAVMVGSGESAAVSQITNQEYHWGRLTVNRTSGLAQFYINGAASGAAIDISTVTGNISTTQRLELFGYQGSNLVKGFCDFIRFQRGTILPASWMADEWARIQRGRIRGIPSATAIWDFNDDLVDGSQGLILTLNTGTAAYAEGWPFCVSPLSYTFAVNYGHEYRISPLNSDAVSRAYRTGAAYLIPGPRKQAYELSFVGITEDQYSAFLAAYEGGEVMDLWLDADLEQTAKVYFDPDNPPVKEGKPQWRNGSLVVNTTLFLTDA